MKFNKAIVTSLIGNFEQYEIKHIVAISYLKGTIIITYIEKETNEIQTTKYNSDDVMINIA